MHVKYKPATLEKTTVKGVHKKYTHKTYSNQITIHNTRPTPIQNLHVIDNIPVSQDDRISINLLIPGLSLPGVEGTSFQENVSVSENDHGDGQEEASGRGIQTKPRVTAQWDTDGDPNADENVAGEDGRVNWTVALDSQETVTLALKYRMSHPESLVVVEGM